jgi:3-keto-5-aminohexanoate cleavage enzyme
MGRMTGTLITVAPTGAASSKADVPALPATLDELVTTAKECEALGASIVHVHAAEPGRLRATVAALRASTSLVVQLAPTGSETELDSGAEMASIPVGAAPHTRLQELGIVASYEIADLDQLASLERLLDAHGLPFGGHVHVELVMGAPGGMPGTAATVVAAERIIRDLPAGATFSATGLGDHALPVMLTSLAAGGHLRVGMADTLMYARNRPVESNMQLVARAVGFAQLAQRPPYTSAQARDVLGVAR